MSKFLGPIHYWLYNKIKIQEDLVQKFMEVSKNLNWDNEIDKKTDFSFGNFDSQPLEAIIDTGNIHGWLQEKIALSQIRLAFVVTELLKDDKNRINDLKKEAFDFGKSIAVQDLNVDSAFKLINDTFPDGMPCDHVNEIIEQNENKIIWVFTKFVHNIYWDNVMGDVSFYFAIRDEFIKGMFSKSKVIYNNFGDSMSIEKG